MTLQGIGLKKHFPVTGGFAMGGPRAWIKAVDGVDVQVMHPNLSLFGLVLAIGIVVDDAIVVVENVERNLRLGMSPKEAAHRTMDEVGGALVAIALVLSAVFIPAAFPDRKRFPLDIFPYRNVMFRHGSSEYHFGRL